MEGPERKRLRTECPPESQVEEQRGDEHITKFLDIVAKREFPLLQSVMLNSLAKHPDVQERVKYLITGDNLYLAALPTTFKTELANYWGRVGNDAHVTWAGDFLPASGVLKFQKKASCFAAAVATFISYKTEKRKTINTLKTILQKAPPEAIVAYLLGQGYPAIRFFQDASQCSKDQLTDLTCRSYVTNGEMTLQNYLEQFGVGLVVNLKTNTDFHDLSVVEHRDWAGEEKELHAMVILGSYQRAGAVFFILQNGWKSKPFLGVTWQCLVKSTATIWFIKEGKLPPFQEDRTDVIAHVDYTDCAAEMGPDAAEPDGFSV